MDVSMIPAGYRIEYRGVRGEVIAVLQEGLVNTELARDRYREERDALWNWSLCDDVAAVYLMSGMAPLAVALADGSEATLP